MEVVGAVGAAVGVVGAVEGGGGGVVSAGRWGFFSRRSFNLPGIHVTSAWSALVYRPPPSRPSAFGGARKASTIGPYWLYPRISTIFPPRTVLTCTQSISYSRPLCRIVLLSVPISTTRSPEATMLLGSSEWILMAALSSPR